MAALPPVYPILDIASLERLGIPPVLAAEAFLECGAAILQFRHKAFWSRDTYAQAAQIAQLCAQSGAGFIVNDRADYAALLGAGLHLGQDDLPPADARRVLGLTPGVTAGVTAGVTVSVTAILGFSTHNPAQMAAAQQEPVDYVAFGPVFATTSKERPDPTTGIELLHTVRTLTALPLVAIGGITRDNAHHCWKAGATSVAVISDLLPVSSPLSGPVSGFTSSSDIKRALRDRMSEWQRLNPR